MGLNLNLFIIELQRSPSGGASANLIAHESEGKNPILGQIIRLNSQIQPFIAIISEALLAFLSKEFRGNRAPHSIVDGELCEPQVS